MFTIITNIKRPHNIRPPILMIIPYILRKYKEFKPLQFGLCII